MHHDKMLYLWSVYMHKSAAQPSLASTQNSFIWIESASDHSQKDWLLTERPRDTEPPYQKYRDTSQKQTCTQPTRIFTWTSKTVAFKFMKLLFSYSFYNVQEIFDKISSDIPKQWHIKHFWLKKSSFSQSS